LEESIDLRLRFLKIMDVPLKNVTVIVRADAQCEIRHVYDVTELCKGMGLERFILRTKWKEE